MVVKRTSSSDIETFPGTDNTSHPGSPVCETLVFPVLLHYLHVSDSLEAVVHGGQQEGGGVGALLDPPDPATHLPI